MRDHARRHDKEHGPARQTLFSPLSFLSTGAILPFFSPSSFQVHFWYSRCDPSQYSDISPEVVRTFCRQGYGSLPLFFFHRYADDSRLRWVIFPFLHDFLQASTLIFFPPLSRKRQHFSLHDVPPPCISTVVGGGLFSLFFNNLPLIYIPFPSPPKVKDLFPSFPPERKYVISDSLDAQILFFHLFLYTESRRIKGSTPSLPLPFSMPLEPGNWYHSHPTLFSPIFVSSRSN